MTLFKKNTSLSSSLCLSSSFKKSHAAFVALAALFVYPNTSQGVGVNRELANKPTTTSSQDPTPVELIKLTSKEPSPKAEILTTSTPSTKEVAQILDVSPPQKTDISQTVTTVKVTSTHKKKQIKKQIASNHDFEQRAQRKEASIYHIR